MYLATVKTEIILLTWRRIPTIISVQVGGEAILTNKVVTYLGVQGGTYLDSSMQLIRRFTSQESGAALLSTPIGKRLLIEVNESIVLYG